MPTRPAALLAIAALAAVLAGCGGSSSTDSTTGARGAVEYEAKPVPGSGGGPVGAAAKSCETNAVEAESLRATGVSCEQARQLMYGWQRAGGCSPAAGAGRSGCTVRAYRCVAAAAGRGTAVSCSRQGRSIAFLAVRR
jgi:hypothetical protein